VGAEIPAEKIPFDWDLFFPQIFGDQHKRGFDIVIANPPYVRVKSLKSSVGEDGVARYEAIWDTLKTGTTDLYYAFIELALTKLASPDGGQIAFIQPNFRQTDSAQQLRKLLTGQIPQHPVNLRLWVDFDEQQIFPTASNYVALLFAERCHSEARAAEFDYSTPLPKSWTDQDSIDWLRPPGLTGRHPAADEWLTIAPARLKRVLDARARSTATLADFAAVEVGVQTSADDVFLFEEHREKSPQILEVKTGTAKRWTPLERALLHPCKKGAAGADYRLLLPYDEEGKLLSEAVLAKRYPLAWRYLQSRRGVLEKRDSGKFKGDHWYRFGREQGIRVVSRPKLIVAAALKDAVNAVIDRSGNVALTASGKGGGGAWAISPRNDTVTLDDLAAMLASESAWDHIVAYGSPQKGGWRGVDSKVLLGIPVAPST